MEHDQKFCGDLWSLVFVNIPTAIVKTYHFEEFSTWNHRWIVASWRSQGCKCLDVFDGIDGLQEKTTHTFFDTFFFSLFFINRYLESLNILLDFQVEFPPDWDFFPCNLKDFSIDFRI